MLPPHIAEHSPRDLEWGSVDSVLALARGMFGIRAECERRCVWCRFFCPHQRTSRHSNDKRAVWSRCVDGYIRPRMFGESFVVESTRVCSAMCGGSIRYLISAAWILFGRSQWPRGLRHELSSPEQTLGSWAQIPLEPCMSVWVYSVFVMSCIQVAT
jgi:hypothetical protein